MLMNAIDATELNKKSNTKQRQRQRLNNNDDYAMSAADHTATGRGRGSRRGRGRGRGRKRGRGRRRYNKDDNEFRQDCDWCRKFRPDKSTYHLSKDCFTRQNQKDPDHFKYSQCHNCKESDRKYIGHTDKQCPVVRKAKQSRAHIAEEQDSSDSMSEGSVKEMLLSLDAKKLKSVF